jgi:CheY-like chemotaxis protein
MSSPDILLIDDEEFQLKLLSRQLAALGNSGVATCSSGSAALTLLKGRACGGVLLFLDLNVPGLDGVEFVRGLVATGYDGALILVSGEDERILESAVRLARAHHLNVLGRMTKPVQMDALRALLDAWRQPSAKAPSREARRYAPEDLRRGIAAGELVNYYQPKVEVATGTLKGVETLVRWQHPADGMIFPGQFIGVAEDGGLIDDWRHYSR